MTRDMERPIQIGIVGIGAMGKGLLFQSKITPGIDCVAVCDVDGQRCMKALSDFGIACQEAQNPDDLQDIVNTGKVAVCEDAGWIAGCEAVDVFVEASSGIRSAIAHCISALEHRKHLILMNSEVDLMFGPLLDAVARNNGVVSTSCDGDQYGVLKHLVEQTGRWGFDLVMAGNIKGYLDPYANPTTIVPEADKRQLDYRMCTSFTDGSKLNIEMAILANAYDLAVRTPGMTGPRLSHVSDVLEAFDFDRLFSDGRPFVDYILGAEPGGGVFVVCHCDDAYQKEMLAYYKMGHGPYYVFYRPYHLCHIEAMDTIFNAAQNHQALLVPRYGMKTNVFSWAKKDLKAGDRLDGLGGYACYGKIESLSDDEQIPGIPICLAQDLVLNRAVPKDRKIRLEDVAMPADRIDFKVYAEAIAAGR